MDIFPPSVISPDSNSLYFPIADMAKMMMLRLYAASICGRYVECYVE